VYVYGVYGFGARTYIAYIYHGGWREKIQIVSPIISSETMIMKEPRPKKRKKARQFVVLKRIASAGFIL
jgi:hypothetical protein